MFFNWGTARSRKSLKKEEIVYCAKNTIDLSEEEIEECSELFSSFYGKYSAKSEIRPGGQVKMGPKYYKKHYCEKYLGKLRPGYEWLAFTFQSQKVQLDKYRKHCITGSKGKFAGASGYSVEIASQQDNAEEWGYL